MLVVAGPFLLGVRPACCGRNISCERRDVGWQVGSAALRAEKEPRQTAVGGCRGSRHLHRDPKKRNRVTVEYYHIDSVSSLKLFELVNTEAAFGSRA